MEEIALVHKRVWSKNIRTGRGPRNNGLNILIFWKYRLMLRSTLTFLPIKIFLYYLLYSMIEMIAFNRSMYHVSLIDCLRICPMTPSFISITGWFNVLLTFPLSFKERDKMIHSSIEKTTIQLKPSNGWYCINLGYCFCAMILDSRYKRISTMVKD